MDPTRAAKDQKHQSKGPSPGRNEPPNTAAICSPGQDVRHVQRSGGQCQGRLNRPPPHAVDEPAWHQICAVDDASARDGPQAEPSDPMSVQRAAKRAMSHTKINHGPPNSVGQAFSHIQSDRPAVSWTLRLTLASIQQGEIICKRISSIPLSCLCTTSSSSPPCVLVHANRHSLPGFFHLVLCFRLTSCSRSAHFSRCALSDFS